MTVLRTMAIFHGPDDLAADRVVMTFHFQVGTDYATAEPQAEAAVASFFNTANTSFSIGEYISPWCQRTGELRTYDMDQPKNARPPTIQPIELGAPGGQGYPEEVAVCLSYHGVGPLKTPRRRGRLYVGPLALRAVEAASSTAPARPANIFIADLAVAATRLLSEPVVWCIRSVTPSENYVIIGGGYIDNALDTQRKRGPETTARTTWGA